MSLTSWSSRVPRLDRKSRVSAGPIEDVGVWLKV